MVKVEYARENHKHTAKAACCHIRNVKSKGIDAAETGE
jgi:hypothetical protein